VKISVIDVSDLGDLKVAAEYFCPVRTTTAVASETRCAS